MQNAHMRVQKVQRVQRRRYRRFAAMLMKSALRDLPFLSPVPHDEEPDPPSTGKQKPCSTSEPGYYSSIACTLSEHLNARRCRCQATDDSGFSKKIRGLMCLFRKMPPFGGAFAQQRPILSPIGQLLPVEGALRYGISFLIHKSC